MKIEVYLRKKASSLLQQPPFKDWEVVRSVEEELKEVSYEFKAKGLALNCDMDDNITVIFLGSEELEQYFEIPFSLNRSTVLDHLGKPLSSGEGLIDPILGEYGPHDLFPRSGYSVHVEYWPKVDKIKMISLMVNEVVPG